jgi:1,2-diacylglycerol 3-beta-galactosyltransferase
MHNAICSDRRPIATALLLSDPQEVHATWLAVKEVDCVLAPTRETEAQALAAGFSPSQVHLSGWPVRHQFDAHGDASKGKSASRHGTESGLLHAGSEREAVLEALGLKPGRFTVFLQGGGEGTARFATTVEAVLGAGGQNPVQIILATGTNKLLQARFAQTPRVYALPFTKEIARYMALSDLIMGKAGPNMLFESVTLGKPFIATTYIPGQETPNLEFIRRHQLGWIALRSDEQASLIHTLAQDPVWLAAQARAVAAYRSWNQARLETLLQRFQGLIDRDDKSIIE